MSCLRTLIGLVGFAMLTIGIAALFLARMPQVLNREIRELGGATTTLQELADQVAGTNFTQENQPDLNIVIDGQVSTTNQVGAAPEIEDQALGELSDVQTTAEQDFQVEVAEVQAEAEAVIQEIQPELTAEESQVVQEAVASQNTVLNSEIDVALVPLTVASAPVPDTSGQGGVAGIAGYEQRTVELEWPRSFRVGGNGAVVLTLKALPTGDVEAVAEIADNQVIATPILIQDRYDEYEAQFTARLVAPDFTSEELTPQMQVLGRGEEGTWRWSLKAPDDSGAFVINIVINLAWQPKPNSGVQPIQARNIWGQALQVDVNYVFGSVTVPQASTLGTVLAFVGFAIQIPLLAEILGGVRKLFFGRRKTTTSRGRVQPSSRNRR